MEYNILAMFRKHRRSLQLDSSSFKEKIIADKGHLIHKIKALDYTGRKAYYFILVEANKERGFLKSLETGGFNLNDFGIVIASCYGDEPTEEIRDLLKTKYGFDV